MADDSPSSGQRPRRILIRGVNWLGDAVMTTPALQRLRQALTGSHITLLTPEKLAPLWEHHPSVDAVLTSAPGESVWSVGRRLRREDFQTALVLPNSVRSALEPWLARIPERIGYARPWRTRLLSQPLSPRPGRVAMHKRSTGEIKALTQSDSPANPTSRAVIPSSAHQSHEYLHLATALGANPEIIPPLVNVTPEETQAAAAKFNIPDGTGSRPIFGLNPGAEYGPAKRWPAGRFVAAAREIQQHTNCVWLLLGGQTDASITGQIASAIRTSSSSVHDLAGRTSLRELCAILKLCRVLLTNDSGPMHVAAALGTPVVAPFGSTSPELTGPGLPGAAGNRLLTAHAACSPCFRRTCPIDFRCMAGISVGEVVAAVQQAGRKQS